MDRGLPGRAVTSAPPDVKASEGEILQRAVANVADRGGELLELSGRIHVRLFGPEPRGDSVGKTNLQERPTGMLAARTSDLDAVARDLNNALNILREVDQRLGVE